MLSQDTSRPGSRFAAFLPGSGPYSARREDDVFRIDDVAVLSSAEAVTPPDGCSLEATDEAWMSVDDAQGDLWKFITPSERKKTVWTCVCIAGPLSGVTLHSSSWFPLSPAPIARSAARPPIAQPPIIRSPIALLLVTQSPFAQPPLGTSAPDGRSRRPSAGPPAPGCRSAGKTVLRQRASAPARHGRARWP